MYNNYNICGKTYAELDTLTDNTGETIKVNIDNYLKQIYISLQHGTHFLPFFQSD